MEALAQIIGKLPYIQAVESARQQLHDPTRTLSMQTYQGIQQAGDMMTFGNLLAQQHKSYMLACSPTEEIA